MQHEHARERKDTRLPVTVFSGFLGTKGYVWLASRPQWVVSYSRAGNTATHEPMGRCWADALRDRWPPKVTPKREAIEERCTELWDDQLSEVAFIGRNLDRVAIQQDWKAMHMNQTESRKGLKHWKEFTDPFPLWETSAQSV